MSDELEGKRIPEVTFKRLDGGSLAEVNSKDLFAGRTVVLFALPGAFTPTCSNRHVPRFNQLAGALRAEGVDDIICLAVNDPYVMAAWAQDQQADDITFIPDADGRFTGLLGMSADKSSAGLGSRSRRYSMLVRDGVIEKAFIEPDQEGDPYTVSDADTMLRHLNPQASALQPVTLFAKPGCPFCRHAKELLNEHGMSFESIELDTHATIQSVLAVTGAATVPQVFIGGKLIGGTEALEGYFKERAAPREAVAA